MLNLGVSDGGGGLGTAGILAGGDSLAGGRSGAGICCAEEVSGISTGLPMVGGGSIVNNRWDLLRRSVLNSDVITSYERGVSC